MADHTESSIHIESSPTAVADVIADVEAYPEWTSQMHSVQVLTQDEEEWPEHVEFVVDAGVFKDTYVLDYTWDIDEDSQGVISWTLVRGEKLTAMDGSYTLRHEGDGTRVTYRLAVDLDLAVPGLLKRQAEKSIVAGALDGLKKRCEG
ncbi:SRPBCC family protein [Austwickia chelonae]|uniref:SRPBCC family protein n=1 Tax=Austwickia chelonae TaxID=100225 RepID=UPI000E26F7AB|nr:SRPBCC family protein [Austwickia chelonae]